MLIYVDGFRQNLFKYEMLYSFRSEVLRSKLNEDQFQVRPPGSHNLNYLITSEPDFLKLKAYPRF